MNNYVKSNYNYEIVEQVVLLWKRLEFGSKRNLSHGQAQSIENEVKK